MASVVVYHSVAELVSDPLLEIKPSTLDRHLRWAMEFGWRPTSLSQVVQHPRDRILGISFDDGFADFSLALPIFEKLGFAPTVFICPGMVGRSNEWSRRKTFEKPLLNEPEIRAIVDRGTEIGCHGWNHEAFIDRRSEDLKTDLNRCNWWFEEKLGCQTATFAYPFGLADACSASVVGGYFTSAFVVDPVPIDVPANLRVPRIPGVEIMSREWFGKQLTERSIDLCDQVEQWRLP